MAESITAGVGLRLFGSPELHLTDAAAAEAVMRQPKRFALLSVLAIEGARGFVRRDRLLGMLWPEQSEERARHALRQSLHALRASIGAKVIVSRGADDLAVDVSTMRCDVPEFERAVKEERHADALALYGGDLLPGFFVAQAPEFERWLDSNRRALRRQASDSGWTLVTAALRAGRENEAVTWAVRAQELSDNDERDLRKLLTVLEQAGDRASALRAYERFREHLRAELEVEPSRETQAIVDRLRVHEPPIRSASSRPATRSAPPGESNAIPAARVPRFSRATIGLLAAALVAATAGLIGWLSTRHQDDIGWRRSVVARRLYDEGLRAYNHSDYVAADQLFGAAEKEDSAFGLASMMRSAALSGLRKDIEALRVQERAVRLAPSQSDHDRLLILAWWANSMDDPRRTVYADTLAIRYPDDAEGQLLLANGRLHLGEFAGAASAARTVIHMDSAALRRDPGERCRSCEAFQVLVWALENGSTLQAAEQTAREWTRIQPRSHRAWRALSYQLAIQRRPVEALAALQRADDLHADGNATAARAEILLRAGDFLTASQVARARIQHGSADERWDAQWVYWFVLREQGRLDEALELARAMQRDGGTAPDRAVNASVVVAHSLFESGRWREAARIWDSMATHPPREYAPSRRARNRVLRLTLRSDALAAAGDIATIALLVDSVQADGLRSGFGRDRLLHHHLRGLILASRGRDAAACAEFKRAVFSKSVAYIRTNLEGARSCLRAGQPTEALAFLRAIMQGPISVGGTYGTRAEAMELIAQAFQQVQQPDSAAIYLERLISSWSHADAPTLARRRLAQERLRTLKGGMMSSRAAARDP